MRTSKSEKWVRKRFQVPSGARNVRASYLSRCSNFPDGYFFFDLTRLLQNRFVNLARKTKIPPRTDITYAESLRSLHSAVLGMSALIGCFPYSVEPWMPPLIDGDNSRREFHRFIAHRCPLQCLRLMLLILLRFQPRFESVLPNSRRYVLLSQSECII